MVALRSRLISAFADADMTKEKDMQPADAFYMTTIILTELMMVAMLLHVINYSGFTRAQKGWYIATFIAIMVWAIYKGISSSATVLYAKPG